MCESCDEGAAILAKAATHNMDVSKLSWPSQHSAATSLRIAGATSKIFHNGSIITMANGKFSDVEALAISDGGIVAAGSMNEAIRVTGIDVDIVDLKNRCILPGFIDPHVHLINTALIGNLFMDMSPSVVPNRDTAISMVETQAMEVMKRAKGEWVVGFGYDPSRVEGHLEIQKGDLDAVTRVKGVDVPVFIVNQSGHLAYMNSLALEIAAEKYNLDDDPYYRKDPDTDELTGVIAETAVNQIVTLVQKPSADDLATWCKQTWDSWARKGCTTVFDCGLGSTGPSDVPIVKAVSEKELMNVRMHGALAHYGVDSFADLLAAPPITTGKNCDPVHKDLGGRLHLRLLSRTHRTIYRWGWRHWSPQPI